MTPLLTVAHDARAREDELRTLERMLRSRPRQRPVPPPAPLHIMARKGLRTRTVPMTIPLTVSVSTAEAACAEAVVAQALGVTVHAIRATEDGGCAVARWRGGTSGQEAVIAAARDAWTGAAVGHGELRARQAAEFILADDSRRTQVRRLAGIVTARGIAYGLSLPRARGVA